MNKAKGIPKSKIDDFWKRQYADKSRRMSDAKLDKELAFARGFGAYDKPTQAWLDALENEKRARTLADLAAGVS